MIVKFKLLFFTENLVLTAMVAIHFHYMKKRTAWTCEFLLSVSWKKVKWVSKDIT